jgi:hypothetical protein
MTKTYCPANRRPSDLLFRELPRAHRGSRAWSALALLSALSQNLGCASGGVDEQPFTEASFLEAYAEEACTRASACCRLSEVGFNASFCRESALAQAQAVKIDLEERGKLWEFHPGHAQRCLEEMEASPGDCSVGFRGSACANVYRGTFGLGQACQRESDCAPAHTPDDEGHTACGRYRSGSGEGTYFCQLVVTTRSIGEQCDVPTGAPGSLAVVETCKEDGFCHRGTCLERSQVGGGCPCAAGLICDGEGTCIAQGQLGSPCEDHDDCGSAVCGDDGTCQGIGEAIRYSLCVSQLPY